MEKQTRVVKNTTKISQVYYNRIGDPVMVPPGGTYVEDLSGVIDAGQLIRQEAERKRMEGDIEEIKRIKKVLASIRVAKSIDDLEKLKKDETNQEILYAIVSREKEILDDTGGVKGKA